MIKHVFNRFPKTKHFVGEIYNKFVQRCVYVYERNLMCEVFNSNQTRYKNSAKHVFEGISKLPLKKIQCQSF